MVKIIRLFYVVSLGLTLLLPMSWPTLAQPRTDFYGPGDSGAYYDFYLDWMYPKRSIETNRRVFPGYLALYKWTEKIRTKLHLGQTDIAAEETQQGAETKTVSE